MEQEDHLKEKVVAVDGFDRPMLSGLAETYRLAKELITEEFHEEWDSQTVAMSHWRSGRTRAELLDENTKEHAMTYTENQARFEALLNIAKENGLITRDEDVRLRSYVDSVT